MKVYVSENYKGIGDTEEYLCMCKNKLMFYVNPNKLEFVFYCDKCDKFYDGEVIECHREYGELNITKNKKTRLRKIFNEMKLKNIQSFDEEFDERKYNAFIKYLR